MKDWFRERFHGLYWRQMAVTVGMVFLTLVLLGVSFFSLSYSYARGQKTDELMVRAMAVSKLLRAVSGDPAAISLWRNCRRTSSSVSWRPLPP